MSELVLAKTLHLDRKVHEMTIVCPLIPDNGTPCQASSLTHQYVLESPDRKTLAAVWQDICHNCSLQGREHIGNWNLTWKIRQSQLPLFRLNLSFEYMCVCMCLLVLYLRRCSCSPCVRTAPPILPEWTTGIYAVMRNKPHRISTVLLFILACELEKNINSLVTCPA